MTVNAAYQKKIRTDGLPTIAMRAVDHDGKVFINRGDIADFVMACAAKEKLPQTKRFLYDFVYLLNSLGRSA